MGKFQAKAILFDMHGTLGYVKRPATPEEFCGYLQSRRCYVYPQEFTAARNFVMMVDYPKHGYANFMAFYAQVLKRLGIRPRHDLLQRLSQVYAKREELHAFLDSGDALKAAKNSGAKTAVVTTIPRFRFRKLLARFGKRIDVVMDGYAVRCEKSNPLIYLKTLRALGVNPSEAVMIGDEIPLDILLPKRLGMRAILLARKGPIDVRNGADGVVKSLSAAVRLATKLSVDSPRVEPSGFQ
jgi:HAD superfamily hydrolase (TIGR01549 family)